MTETTTTTIPAGWKLVPIEPTPEMVDAACKWNSERGNYSMAYAAMVDAAPSPAPAAPSAAQPALEFGYTNWRGEYARRRVRPVRLYHGSTEWHPEPQWLMEAYDADKGGLRAFAVKDMVFGAQPAQGGSVSETDDEGPTYRIRITPDMTYDQINAAAAAEEARVEAPTEAAKLIAWAVHLHHGVALYDDANDLWSAISVEKKAEWLSAARASAPEVVKAVEDRTKKLLQRAGMLSGVARHIKGGKPMTKDVADMLSSDATHILCELAALGISHCGISDTEAAALRTAGEAANG